MEKTFRRMIERPSARAAYVRAEVATALAHQIRALRVQRGWTQRDLARRLQTSTSVVSRFEDPSYGKLSLQTLIDLSQVFDIGLSVRFMSLVDMVRQTFIPNAADRYVEPFENESASIGFVADVPVTSTVVCLHGERAAAASSSSSSTPTAPARVRQGLLQSVALPTAFSNSIAIRL